MPTMNTRKSDSSIVQNLFCLIRHSKWFRDTPFVKLPGVAFGHNYVTRQPCYVQHYTSNAGARLVKVSCGQFSVTHVRSFEYMCILCFLVRKSAQAVTCPASQMSVSYACLSISYVKRSKIMLILDQGNVTGNRGLSMRHERVPSHHFV
jgi:hypothetical protein